MKYDHTFVYTEEKQTPPLKPKLHGGKSAISCELPGKYLIRAWCPNFYSPALTLDRLVSWITAYTGRIQLSNHVWFGYTYSGIPLYMGEHPDSYGSGLTIQHFLREVPHSGLKEYGEPKVLDIPQMGYSLAKVLRCEKEKT